MSTASKKAVALRYPEGAPAPFITASAKGRGADRLLDIAEKNGIPVVNNGAVTDILSVQEIGSYVPEETWTVLAGIFAFVLETERGTKSGKSD